jgi:tetratricopeptide (TPR) repeat protein
MQLRLTSAAGGEIGTIIYTADATEANGKKLWLIRSHQLVTLNNMLQDTAVEAERDSFAPVTGRTANSEMGDYRAAYQSDKVTLTTEVKGKETSKPFGVKGPVFDNEQALYLIRRLPLAEGYKTSFTIFTVMGGQTVECRIAITGKEKVIVPAGSYDCWKTNLQVWAEGTKTLEHQLWFSQDAHHYLVKYDASSALMELTEVSTASNKSSDYAYPELGAAISLPAGWFAYRHPGKQAGPLMIQLLAPEAGTWALLAALPGTKEVLPGTSVREVAEGDVTTLKGYFKGYTVRSDSWSEPKVAGLPASRFIADYEDDGVAMVEYRTYILGDSVWWFVSRIAKDQFAKMQPIYDAIVDGFKPGAAASRPASSQPATADAMGMLDSETRSKIEYFDKEFASWFQPEGKYEAASASEKEAMAEQWMADARSDDFKKRTRAIAALGNIRCKEAVGVLIEVAEEPMSNNRPKWMAVRALGRIGDKAAVPTLIELIDHGNTNVRVYSRLALAQITDQYQGDSKEKWRAWWKAHGQKAAPADKKTSENERARGWRLWFQKKFDEAETAFKNSVRTDPANANAWQGLGWSQFNLGKIKQAKDSFEKCIALQKDNAAALNGLGWIAKVQDKVDEAIKFWEKAVEADPKGTAAIAGLAAAYMEKNEPAKAAKYYEMWLKAEPKNEEARNGLSKAKAEKGAEPAAQ